MSKYRKLVVAAAGAAFTALATVISDGAITNAEWITVGVAILTALGVYFVPNKTDA